MREPRRAWRAWLMPIGILRALEDIERKVDRIMTKQDDLNRLVDRIGTATDGIKADVAQLKADNPDVDFSSLEARVGDLEGLDAENPAPENPAA